MRFTKCTIEDLKKALVIVNKKYDDNIIFNRLDNKGFTLKVRDSKQSGHRRGFPVYDDVLAGTGMKQGKRLSSACWHVHGDFFEALFSVNPNAVIHSRGNRIDQQYGNWEDCNIGSQYRPFYFSEACDC